MSNMMYGICRLGETTPSTPVPEKMSRRSLMYRTAIAEDLVSERADEFDDVAYVTLSNGRLLTVHEVRIVRTTYTFGCLIKDSDSHGEPGSTGKDEK